MMGTLLRTEMCALVFLLLMFSSVHAEDKNIAQSRPEATERYIEKLKEITDGKALPEPEFRMPDENQKDRMFPSQIGGISSDPNTYTTYLQALQEYYKYRISGLKHRQRVFDWQLLSSKIIFFVVVTLVLAGVYFAAVQFHVGLKSKNIQGDTQMETTEFSASMEGIKVSSPILGVIILALSLGFFYLYLVFVYPISEIF